MKTTSFLVALTLAMAAAHPAFAQDETEAPPASEPATPEEAPPAPAPPIPARAPAPRPAPAVYLQTSVQEPDAVLRPVPRYDLVRVGAGIRVGYVGSAAFSQFSKNDVLAQFSLEGTYALVTSGKFALAVGGAWDIGSSSATTRATQSSVTLHRLTAPIEARYHSAPWFYGFARVAPGAAAFAGSIRDSSAPAKLTDTAWAFATDVSVGVSLHPGANRQPDVRRARFWFTPEFGYAFTTETNLRPSPDRKSSDVLGEDQRVALGSIDARGVFWRVSGGVTF
ncbi:hypothetical protein AKJ09_09416 [Labilithrix luteola]|uniref:Outer membrane protein beta-barrel domain-containing protein n=1 Tax=Labilithrix luteola TaxID=1391654 RepID=A0A0K1QAK2_9BACT|nr:hypothetical protein [Labilithrix luteola]AKV02753.1 hypothetical protein AKJ09_09416 [Labilithrix luteola]